MSSAPATGPTAVVVAAGADADLLAAAPEANDVVCADSGIVVAQAAGLAVDLIVGDLDSAPRDAVAAAVAEGATVERHPVDKDQSDLELALAAALLRGATRLDVHLGAGGRLDHQLANLLVLCSPRWAAATIDAHIGADRAWVVRKRRVLPIVAGEPVALHSLGGAATGVRTRGLAFELAGETLEAMVARGISNSALRDGPEVTVTGGVLLAISVDQSAHAV